MGRRRFGERVGNGLGKSIFGIRAAAWFYFRKAPQQINVDEAIFLACIIPNPRHAAALLEDDGSLTPYAQEYFDTMRWMLYEGDWIGEEWLQAEYPVFRRART
ncbi:MAG: transglycosylase domain-containing protein [Bacteroidetes bacterium]|nr:transglycosylase domain-containing protein [Bacteroidota bacterium]